MSTTFAARLNRLFDVVYPPGRGPHTSAEVIAALKAEGVTMSAPYLSQLRSGNRTAWAMNDAAINGRPIQRTRRTKGETIATVLLFYFLRSGLGTHRRIGKPGRWQ